LLFKFGNNLIVSVYNRNYQTDKEIAGKKVVR